MSDKYSIVVEAATKQAQKELQDLGKNASNAFDAARVKAVQFETGATNAFRNIHTKFAGMATAISAVVAGQIAKSALQTADSYTLLDNKLKLVTGSAGELAAVHQGLYDQAMRSHSSYAASVDLYTRFARATQNLGTSQRELLRIVETVNKAFIISGATQEEASNAITQLSQGMASGVLRGEEFNSIMEQGSRVAQILAEHLKTDVGGLRKLAGEGKITSEVIVSAFAASAQKIDTEFGKIEATIGQAMTNLRTVIGSLVSDTNTAAGSTNKIAYGIENIATTIDQNRDGIIELFSTMLSIANGVVGATANIGRSIAGWSAVKRGDLGFMEFARMNPEELAAWMKAHDTPTKNIQSRIDQYEQALSKTRAKQAGVILPAYQGAYSGDIQRGEDTLSLLYAARANVGQWSPGAVLAGKPTVAPPPTPPSSGGSSGGTSAGGRGTTAAGAIAVGDMGDFWRYQVRDLYDVQSRAWDIMAHQEQETAASAIAAGQATPKDFWQIQADERYEIQSRGLDAIIQAEEAAGRHMQELSERTAEAMEQAFSDLYFSAMQGKFDTFADYATGILQTLQRATADYLGQLTQTALFGDKGSGGLVNTAISWIGNALMFHGGGVVGRDFNYMPAPALAFAGAPRLHGGLAADEFPAILQRGETVLPRGTSTGPAVNIVVNNNTAGTAARVENHGGFNFEVIVEQVEKSVTGRAQRGTGIGPWLDSRYHKVR